MNVPTPNSYVEVALAAVGAGFITFALIYTAQEFPWVIAFFAGYISALLTDKDWRD